MHIKYIYDRRWMRPENHLDARYCPDCAVTVHGKHGQRGHQRHHIEETEQAELIDRRLERLETLLRLPPLDQEPEQIAWTAVVDDGQEAIGG